MTNLCIRNQDQTANSVSPKVTQTTNDQKNQPLIMFCRVQDAARSLYCRSGDQAGSLASAGVTTRLSLNPVISMRYKCVSPPSPVSDTGCCLKYIKTRPFGAQVGASTKKPRANKRSPLPSTFITPMKNSPRYILVKAIISPRGDHTGVAYRPLPKLMRRTRRYHQHAWYRAVAIRPCRN